MIDCPDPNGADAGWNVVRQGIVGRVGKIARRLNDVRDHRHRHAFVVLQLRELVLVAEDLLVGLHDGEQRAEQEQADQQRDHELDQRESTLGHVERDALSA